MTTASAAYAPGDVIAGRYRVCGLLGQGGMGTVWRVADQADGGRELALKTILSRGEITPVQALAFREEYRAMTRLGHPNTIDVQGFGALDGHTRYLTMELVPGRELAEVIGSAPMPLDEAYALLAQLLQALDFIHSRLYVHRDIKSANVRVKPDGTLKLMDFGLMAQLGTPARGGSISGSPGYLAPEAIRGGTLEAAADLYSVGCLAFEMLTGELPFKGTLREVLRAHAEVPAPALRSVRRDAPEALERLVARLLEKEPARRYRGAAEALVDLAALSGRTAATPSPAQARSYLVAGTLVGRDAELAELEGALTRALAGEGAAILVGAPAGTGKSRLVAELLVRARLADAQVLEARCQEGGGGPYEPLAQALLPLVGLTPEAEAARFAPALALLFDRRAAGTGGLPTAAPDEETHRAALEALTGWLAWHAARQPLVVAIDDLHWADGGTLDVLRHLCRRVAGLRFLLVGGLRDDEAGAAPLLRAAAEGGLTRVRLAPFAPGQVDALLRATLRDYAIAPAVLERLVRTTGGNAFFVTEALRWLMEDGALTREGATWCFPADPERLALPANVEAVVLRRLAALDPGALAVARAAAVMGGSICRSALHTLVGGDEEALFCALDALVERQVLVREPVGYAFFHDRVREAIYADIQAPERTALHQRFADHLEATHDPRESQTASELAHHYTRGGVPGKAWRYHDRVAGVALASGALPCALTHWRAAVEAAQADAHPEREARLAALWWEIGSRGTLLDPEGAIAALEGLIGVLEGVCVADCWSSRLRVVAGLARKLPAAWRDRVLVKLMTPEPYVHRVRTGWRKALPPHLPSWMPRLVESYGYLAAAHGFAGRPERGLALAERALALFPFEGTPLEGSLRLVRCTNLFPAGHLDALLIEAARAQALLADDRYPCPAHTKQLTRVASASYRLAVAYQGRRPDAARAREARALAEAFGPFDIRNDATHWPALWAAWSGRRAEARAWIDEAARACREADAPADAHGVYLDGLLRLQAGDVAEALATTERALAADHLPPGAYVRQRLVVLRGQALLAAADLAGARAAFEEALAAAERAGLGQLGLMARLGCAEAALAAGDLQAADAALEPALKAAAEGPLRNPLFEAIALRLLARRALAAGATEAARQRLDAALAIVGSADLDNPLEQAHVTQLMAEVCAASGERDQAAAMFARAAAQFEDLGATAFAAPARAALAGLPPAPPNWMVSRAFGL